MLPSQRLIRNSDKQKKKGNGTSCNAFLVIIFIVIIILVVFSSKLTDVKNQNSITHFLDRSNSQNTNNFNKLKIDALNNRPIKKRPRLAYAITITKDGFFQDGAAVLAYSIFKVSNGSVYDISLIAFVHPNVTKSRPILSKLGYHVIEVPKPINVSAINDDWVFYKTKIEKNGCCGASELIKLNAYRYSKSSQSSI